MAKRRANGEGSIYKRQDGTWTAQYHDAAGTRKYLYGKTQQAVKDKLKAAISQVDKGVPDLSKIKFVDWMWEWLEVYAKPTVKPSSYGSYYQIIRDHIGPFFGKVLLKDLKAEQLQKFFNEKAEGGRMDRERDPETGAFLPKKGGLSVGTLYSFKRVMSAAIVKAIDLEMIYTNPLKKVSMPKKRPPEIHVLSVEDQKKLEAAALHYHKAYAFGIFLTLYTGLRIGELLGLKLEDIDLEKKELYVRRTLSRMWTPDDPVCKRRVGVGDPKTESSNRTIPLPDFIIDLIKQYIERRNKNAEEIAVMMQERARKKGEESTWVDEGWFLISAYGNRMEWSHYTQAYAQVIEEAGIEYVNFHVLRHTFATRALEAGFDVKSLSEILGHSDAKITLDVYAHAMDDHKRSNMDKLGQIFNAKP